MELPTGLVELGLTPHEATIYRYLLEHPGTTTGPLIAKTGIANSRVYQALQSLARRGLVTSATHKEGKRYEAADPDALLTELDERRKRATATVQELKRLRHTTAPPTTTAVHEGFAGFRTAFSRIIDECQPGGVIRIIGFSQQEFAQGSLQAFLKNMNRKSAQKRQQLRILLDEESRTMQGRDRKKERQTTVRYLPKGSISPAAIDITSTSVTIFLWDREPYAFTIRNQRVAKSFISYFDALWHTARR